MRNDSSGDDLIFLSGESEPEQEHSEQEPGASPRLRRSARKRKSTSGIEHSMHKGSTSKKKKTSPASKMPKVTRSPPKGASQKQPDPKPQDLPQAQGSQGNPSGSFEALLVAMEERLSAKIEKAS